MADFNIDRIRFRWRGTWTISTSYIKDDIVLYKGKAYVCLVGHSSDSTYFYDDLEDTVPKWELMLDGYQWRGDWTTSTYYTPGDTVKFKGYVYQCIAQHTSIPVATSGLPGNIANWTIVATTYNWLNEWTANAYYDLGDVVRYRGITYICNTKHRANASVTLGLEADQSKWSVVTSSDSWYADWTTSRRYKVKDIVKYGGIVYRCIDDHTSAATAALGLEDNQSDWEIVISGIEYKFDWSVSTRYKLNDIVKWNHSLWICNTYHTSGLLNLRSDESNWTEWLPGTGFESVWSSGIEYKKGDIVLHGGYAYTALTNNTGSLPSVNGILQDTGDWELLKEGYKHRGEWNNTTSYQPGDVVRNNGYLYVAIDDNASIYPDLETHWTKIVVGSYWRSEWDIANTYYIGDIVTYAGTAYYCIARHTSTSGTDRPDIDIAGAGSYWITFIQGTTTNVLTTRGDLRTHDGSNTLRYGIGNSGNVLKSVDSNLFWQNFEQVNKVYYVSTTGTDQIDNGRTLNAPFRTVKYAMDFILADEATRAPATVFIKSGLYEEILPISVPANVALVGDELRSTTIMPAATYEQENMFYVRNGSGIRNMTLQGLTGTLGPTNEYGTSRPTAGAFVSLDPGTGPADSSVWITTKSPYVQNVSTFGIGCTGMKIDGSLHNSGNRSIVANDFTQIVDNGIGYWATNGGRSELVSVFTYFCYIGYLASDGGILRATNGNNSYGTYGSRAEGVSLTETPILAEIDNKSFEASIDHVATNGTSVVAYSYANCGQSYSTATTTLIGGGINFSAVYEEFRNNAISQARVISPADSSIAGGLNYQYLLNSAQTGDQYSITLAAADTTGTSEKYVGMRVFISAGKGIGQYAEITGYDAVSKVAIVSRESDGANGWDHIYPGYPIESTLDSTTRYRVEPRVIIPEPTFTTTAIVGPSSDAWSHIVYGGDKFVAVTAGGAGIGYATYSTNGTTWSTPADVGTNFVLSGIVYTGSKFLIARKETNAGATVNTIVQSSNGITWSTVSLGTLGKWSSIATDRNGKVVIVDSTSQTVLYSGNNGDNWTTASIGGTTEVWNKVAYGRGLFVALDSTAGSVAVSDDDGATWTITAGALSTRTWNDLVYGNGRFVAISSTLNITAYSFDGITWYESSIPSGTYTTLAYDSGVFLALGNGSTVAKSSDGGIWRLSGQDSSAFTTTQSGNWTKAAAGPNGSYVLIQSGSGNWNSIETGARAVIRAIVDASRITQFVIYDPGSNYLSYPSITVYDPDNTTDVQSHVFVSNGVLPQPTFINRGTGYTTATATVSGNGFAENFQNGNTLIIKNLERLPGPGDNLIVDGIDDVVYRVVAVDSSSGSEPTLSAVIRISPSMGKQESPADSTDIIIRQSFSQIRLTGHDFLDIGTGGKNTTQYPDLYVEGFTSENERAQENEVTEISGGRVFYTSTDQDGNFRVGELFRVDQSTGVVSISADFFDLSGLSELSLGGIQVGGSAVVIREFSKEATFVATSNNVVPTQRAIKTYLESRITSGGSDAVTNTLIAGRVRLSGTSITTTSGEAIEIDVPVNQTGGGISGDYLALQYFTFGQRVGN
jgi:hypothetical protein